MLLENALPIVGIQTALLLYWQMNSASASLSSSGDWKALGKLGVSEPCRRELLAHTGELLAHEKRTFENHTTVVTKNLDPPIAPIIVGAAGFWKRKPAQRLPDCVMVAQQTLNLFV